MIIIIISSRLLGYLAFFSTPAQKKKKKKKKKKNLLDFLYFLKNIFLTFCEMELSIPKIKKPLILYNLNLSYLYFFQKNLALKKFLIFWEMELSSPKPKLFIFQEDF